MEQFEGWTDVPWNMGRELTFDPPNPIKYYSSNFMQPEDYPMTGTGFHFLVSSRITKILKDNCISGVDYYNSEIIFSNGFVIKDYFTLNILNVVDCLDKDLSKYEVKKFGSAEIYLFDKIAIDIIKVPKDTKLFHLKNHVTHTIVHASIKEELENANVTGIEFIKLNEDL
ncbi:imm11 family protein [Acetivibrio cellulolyticus]